MKTIILLLSVLIGGSVHCQTAIEWTPHYELTLADFQSPSSEIDPELTSTFIQSGAQMEFAFQMSSYEFMFTKNFNSRVKTVFYKNMAAIVAPDSSNINPLLTSAQFNFDLTELYSRKFRKELHAQKGTFSDISFFQPIYDELQAELSARNARAMKESDLGRKQEVLQQEHQKVLDEISLLSDYCKDCKPPKRKKKQ